MYHFLIAIAIKFLVLVNLDYVALKLSSHLGDNMNVDIKVA